MRIEHFVQNVIFMHFPHLPVLGLIKQHSSNKILFQPNQWVSKFGLLCTLNRRLNAL